MSSRGGGTSTFVIRWVNLITMLVAAAVIVYGVWMSIHHDSCRKSLTLPFMGLGSIIFLISIVGFLGALKNNSILLWMYLLMLCLVLVGILVFTVVVFIVTNNGSGHNVAGLRYKEYQLQDYGSWFIKKLNNTRNWKHIQSCFVKNETCNSLPKRYKTLKLFKLAKLTPIEAGCCRPPSQCGYPAVNASYYDISFHPLSSNKDCKLYKNLKAVKCYNCDSCKAGVAQYIKTEWRVIAIFNMILFVVLGPHLYYSTGPPQSMGRPCCQDKLKILKDNYHLRVMPKLKKLEVPILKSDKKNTGGRLGKTIDWHTLEEDFD